MQDAGYSCVATDKSQVETAFKHHNELQPLAAEDREQNKKEPMLHRLHTCFLSAKVYMVACQVPYRKVAAKESISKTL